MLLVADEFMRRNDMVLVEADGRVRHVKPTEDIGRLWFVFDGPEAVAGDLLEEANGGVIRGLLAVAALSHHLSHHLSHLWRPFRGSGLIGTVARWCRCRARIGDAEAKTKTNACYF